MEEATEIDAFDILKRDIGILRDLQRMLISIFVCDENQHSNIAQLFHFFDEISISENFSVYEGFLRLLIHIFSAFCCAKNHKNHLTIFLSIIKRLIIKHSLKQSFEQSTLFFIFQANKHFLLFLFEEGVIDLSSIIQYIYLYDRDDLFLFFAPEIRKYVPSKYQYFIELFRDDGRVISNLISQSNEKKDMEGQFPDEVDIENLLEVRKEIHSNEKIARIIREDDMDSFIKTFSEKDPVIIDDYIYSSYLENNRDVNDNKQGKYQLNFRKRVSFLEYSMAFGSINIFHYLWLHNAEYQENSLQYSIIGGNYEIIHILEEESKFAFNERHYYKSFDYYHKEITEYLRNLIGINQFAISTINMQMRKSNGADFEFCYECLINQDANNDTINKKGTKNEDKKLAIENEGNVVPENQPIYEILLHSIVSQPHLSFFVFYQYIFHSDIDINYQYGRRKVIINLFKRHHFIKHVEKDIMKL
ncbi:hypothetical protein TRFO_03320 [Tritrichomonas foetus]|uniref:DUF3447 domain-containing protein n=1 Tax=Tritrichomonas foetus TaxID=1144522 RepID=A0A1J4KV39_9EUKA|nr:hypothetical protein TRFO_03320 [Tritrichomonas foetus]|eukprot:OHT13566.1 hypothetical protein TRFO_03320 [Tritrichomonas foetus]